MPTQQPGQGPESGPLSDRGPVTPDRPTRTRGAGPGPRSWPSLRHGITASSRADPDRARVTVPTNPYVGDGRSISPPASPTDQSGVRAGETPKVSTASSTTRWGFAADRPPWWTSRTGRVRDAEPAGPMPTRYVRNRGKADGRPRQGSPVVLKKRKWPGTTPGSGVEITPVHHPVVARTCDLALAPGFGRSREPCRLRPSRPSTGGKARTRTGRCSRRPEEASFALGCSTGATSGGGRDGSHACRRWPG